MGLLNRLFGKEPALQVTADKPEKARTVEVWETGSMLQISSLEFFGPYCRSPNGRYTLAWCDGSALRGGARDSGEGRYILLDDKQVVVAGAMQRPNDGRVADNGTFVLNDWRFSSELTGTFWAFRSDGSRILSRSFSANLFNNGLSVDGALACCQTCNSPSEDSSVLAIFDLIGGQEISTFSAESGWASDYEFSPGAGVVRLRYQNEGTVFGYALLGEFIERDKWVAARLQGGDLYMVKRTLEEAGGSPDVVMAKRLLDAIEIGLGHQNWRDDRSQALGWRLRGEILEATDAVAQALECYDKALALNAKIGIKRRVDQLRKSLSAKAASEGQGASTGPKPGNF